MIAVPKDETGRMFVVDQIGMVKIITPDHKVLTEPFLDLRDRMVRQVRATMNGVFSPLHFIRIIKTMVVSLCYYSHPCNPVRRRAGAARTASLNSG